MSGKLTGYSGNRLEQLHKVQETLQVIVLVASRIEAQLEANGISIPELEARVEGLSLLLEKCHTTLQPIRSPTTRRTLALPGETAPPMQELAFLDVSDMSAEDFDRWVARIRGGGA